ncbi:MAG: DUF6020 family protein, partial [Coriobacteriales bacterium]|nr:DUF6020 family protein [Coriobacteriales bacterium]
MKKIIKTLFSGGQQVAAAALLALLFSATTIFISPIYLNTSLDWHLWLPNGWLMTSAQALLWALPLFLLLLVALTYGGVFLRWLARFNPLKKLSFSWSKRSVLITAAILLIFWLPWIIIYYPGSTPYDPVAQIYQIHGSGAFRPEIWEPTVDGWISNSHPILHTLILGGFFELGNALGSQNLGIFMYSLFQTLVRAITFAVVCCYLMRLRTPKVFCLLTLAFFALFPAIASSSMVTFKDHLFSPVSVIYALLVIEIVRTRGAALKSKRFVGALATASLLMPLLKHPGIYIVVASGICLLVIYRRYWKQFLISLSLPIGFVYII